MGRRIGFLKKPSLSFGIFGRTQRTFIRLSLGILGGILLLILLTLERGKKADLLPEEKTLLERAEMALK